jgi:serine kinase of HPr protein (carbohydrate metabolism regulator)
MTPAPARVHGTCVAIGSVGVLLLGPSGSGKSDLALRLIDGGARLVADDQVAVAVRGRCLMASAPPLLPPLLELRGVGLVPVPRLAETALAAAFSLREGGHPERLPEPDSWHHGGVAIPLYTLDPGAASAPARVRLLVRQAPLAVEPLAEEPPA